MCFSNIFKKKQPVLPPPIILDPENGRKQVDNPYIFKILNALKPNPTHIYLSDNTYWLCSKEDIEKFLAIDVTKDFEYVTEKYDCDDFSYRLLGQLSVPEWSGIAFGIVWTNLHALNCLIDDAGKFWYIEPQMGRLQETLEPWQGNEILFIML